MCDHHSPLRPKGLRLMRARLLPLRQRASCPPDCIRTTQSGPSQSVPVKAVGSPIRVMCDHHSPLRPQGPALDARALATAQTASVVPARLHPDDPEWPVAVRPGQGRREPYTCYVRPPLATPSQGPALDARALATAQTASVVPARLHPDDREWLVAQVADRVVARVAEELMSCLVGDIDASKAAQDAAPSPDGLLTTDEVLALRPGIRRSWLYRNSAECGAIKKNLSRRSPLWFRLADVDAELQRRRKKPVKPVPAPRSARRQAKLRATAARLATNGAASPFVVRPRPARAGA